MAGQTAPGLIKLVSLSERKIQPYDDLLVSISGIIGAGKTTLIDKFLEKLGSTPVAHEPCQTGPVQEQNWLLDKFYHSPDKYAFPMQLLLLHKRLVAQRIAIKAAAAASADPSLIITDRCFLEDSCFEEVLHDMGFITDIEHRVYEECLASMCMSSRTPDLVIFLRVTPETALARTKARGNACEAKMELDYLVKLDAAYQKWLGEMRDIAAVAVVDWNGEMPESVVGQLLGHVILPSWEAAIHSPMCQMSNKAYFV